jgi:glyoxylase-like metal-dependent hydrolase (beta-lactamase superfamily II)
MTVSFDVISIGCLSHNHFWNERQPVRGPHATTSLIRDAGQTILVDPSLPPDLLTHRLDERTGLKPEQINRVFLTSFQPVHRRALSHFAHAEWLMFEAEIQSYREHLDKALDSSATGDARQDDLVRHELALLDRITPAPDKLTSSVHLFPSPGVTPGSCSLLVLSPTTTLVIAGDAVINRDYLEHGQVFEGSVDVEQATESLSEILEIADQVVCGHDNLIVCPGRRL